MQPVNPSIQKCIHIFISSTFRDMQGERDELVKYVFPKLTDLCSLKNIKLVELELRWGITAEESSGGKALSICLDEIDRCRPFFIGILGERYGWVQDSIPAFIVTQYPFLSTMEGKSISEIEITYGAFTKIDPPPHAFFYFRDPSYLECLPPGSIISDFQSENPLSAIKMKNLKNKIRNSPYKIRENYQNTREFGDLVLVDLLNLINQLHPEEIELSDELIEEQQQEAYARKLRASYIVQSDYWKTLGDFIESQDSLLIISGESGAGKSTLIANWTEEYQKKNPDVTLITHYVDSTSSSTDYYGMLRRILRLINAKFDLQIEIPKQSGDLRNVFANALHMVSNKGKLVLVIDSIDLLSDPVASGDLAWLPPTIPGNMNVILSTVPGEMVEKLQSTGYKILKLRPFREDECRSLILSYLSIYSKHLSEDQIQQILKAPKIMNPLFLYSLLQELRLYGDFDTLMDWLRSLLESVTVSSLYDKILSRYEKDYNHVRPNLVQDTFSLIRCSRKGLSESELLELLGTASPVPPDEWAHLSIALDAMLVDQSGLFNIFHTFLQKAIEKRYLKNPEDRILAHKKLATYWATQKSSLRKRLEYPWNLVQSKNYDQLTTELIHLDFFVDLYTHQKEDVFTFWNLIESNSDHRKEKEYKSIVMHSHDYPEESLVLLSEFFVQTGLVDYAFQLCEDIEKRCGLKNNQICLISALNIKADILKSKGNLQEAMKIYERTEELCLETGNKKDAVISINSEACILYNLGKWDEAFVLHQQAYQIAKESGDQKGLSESINNQAIVLENWGKLQEAWDLHKESEAISREIHDLIGLSVSLNHQARILQSWNKMEEALSLYKETYSIAKDLGDLFNMALSLNNQATLYSADGKQKEAWSLYQEAESIFRKLDDQIQLSSVLVNQGALLRKWGRLEEAWDLYKEAEQIFRKIDNPLKLSICLNNEAYILNEWGSWQDALILYREAESLFRNLDYKKGIATTLSHQGKILCLNNDKTKGITFLKEALTIAVENGFIQIEQQIQETLNQQI
jgi:tetratricopeptide (TPR) repeat protein